MTILVYISITCIVLLFINVYQYLNSKAKDNIIKEYDEFTEKQRKFIEQIRNDYDHLAEKFYLYLTNSKKMSLDDYIEITCKEGNINVQDFKDVLDQIKKRNYLNMEDFDRLLHIGFPIGVEISELKKVHRSEVREIINEKEVSAADFIAIVLSNTIYNRYLEKRIQNRL